MNNFRRSILTQSNRRILAFTVLAVFIAILLSACGTTGSRALPAYEAPLAKGDFQSVRTTAYTHTESDHTQYGARNALGGELHAAGAPIRRAENTPLARALSDSNDEDIQRVSNSGAALNRGASIGTSLKIGSAAAELSSRQADDLANRGAGKRSGGNALIRNSASRMAEKKRLADRRAKSFSRAARGLGPRGGLVVSYAA